MNSKYKLLDDLTVIKGIGPVRQEWMRNTLGIHSYKNLAELSPDVIVSRLKSEGMIASYGEVKMWVAQAQRLADAESPSTPGEWVPFASFVVEFQSRLGRNGSEELCTTVQHMEADEDEKWPGMETERLCRWMDERVGDRQMSVEAHPTALPTNILPSIVVEQVQVFQPVEAEMPAALSTQGHAFKGFVRESEPIELQVTFTVTGLETLNLPKDQVACVTQVYLRKLPSSERTHLVDTFSVNLADSQSSYTALTPPVSLLAGAYNLIAIARLSVTPPVFTYLEAPMLQVY